MLCKLVNNFIFLLKTVVGNVRMDPWSPTYRRQAGISATRDTCPGIKK